MGHCLPISLIPFQNVVHPPSFFAGIIFAKHPGPSFPSGDSISPYAEMTGWGEFSEKIEEIAFYGISLSFPPYECYKWAIGLFLVAISNIYIRI
jgi:hypothetical protein